MCVAYRLGDTVLEHFPEDTTLLEGPIEPVWEVWPGWEGQVADAKTYQDLPVQARRFLEYLADSLGTRLSWVSTGPDRNRLLCL